MTRDYNGPTSYGAGPGTPGRRPDGTARPLSAREQAQVVRQAGIDDDSGVPIPLLSDTRAAQEEQRARLRQRTNSYSDDVAGMSDPA